MDCFHEITAAAALKADTASSLKDEAMCAIDEILVETDYCKMNGSDHLNSVWLTSISIGSQVDRNLC